MTIRGKIEAFRDGILFGWIWDESATDVHLPFHLSIDGVRIGRFVADLTRLDLRNKQIGKGDHAFKIVIPPDFSSGGIHEASIEIVGHESFKLAPLRYRSDIKAKDRDTATDHQSPRKSESALDSVRPIMRGRLERIDRGYLFGWIWDTISERQVRFNLLVNERDVGEFDAGWRRLDLVKAGIGNGNHGFKIKLDPSWFAPGENMITVRTLPDQQRLPDALIMYESDIFNTINSFDIKPPINSSGIERQGPHRTEVANQTAAPLHNRGASHGHGASSTTSNANELELLPRDIARIMRSWNTTRLVSFYATFEKDILLERAKKLSRDKEWQELCLIVSTASPERRGRAELDVLIGRALLNDGKADEATQLLSRVAQVSINSADAQFYAATACARSGDYRGAVEFGRRASELAPDNAQYLIDHATNSRRLAARIENNSTLKRDTLAESTDFYRRAIALGTSRLDFCLLNIARSEMDLERFEFALAAIEELLAVDSNNVDGLTIMSQALVSLNRVKEALSVAERVVELDPIRQGPRFLLRSLQALVQDEDRPAPTFAIAQWAEDTKSLAISQIIFEAGSYFLARGITLEYSAQPVISLSSINATWLVFAEGNVQEIIADVDGISRLQRNALSWAGRITGTIAGQAVEIWRTELLINLSQSKVFSDLGTMRQSLGSVLELVATIDLESSRQSTGKPTLDLARFEPGPVIAMSRHGIVKFGGGEQFLESMAEHYQQMGFDPIVVGTRPERVGERGTHDGRRYAFVDMTASALREYFLEVRPRFVHVLSGLGFQTAEALDYLNIPFVYGVHFWRDCLGASQDDMKFFAAHDKEPIPKPQFRYVIEKAATVYSNSEYTRAILEESFSIRTPVIYSVPREVENILPGSAEDVEAVIGSERDYVLLVNAKNDKGFGLMVETAKRVPEALFVAIASQSDRSEALAAIDAAGITNFKIIGHTHRMDIAYSRARVVAVPSYKFVETFSRVCIEAQRFEKPVIGSNVGNVPYLLHRCGVILKEEPEAWASEIARIFGDEDYYTRLIDAAKINARAYGYDRQRDAVSGMIATAPSNILVGVGSGIGNMLHVSPMIRNLARRIGRKIDIVMTEDHSNSLFLLQNDEYVNSVYAVRQETLRRRYDAVFITHSFGNARLAFQHQNVIYARDWQNFEPGGPLHETVYNLEAAKQLLGIPYDDDDTKGYFVSNYTYDFPRERLRVGIHGGSKDGFWRSKRWPGHEALAEHLQALGAEVFSFGIPEEYVPGTIDLTGGTISQMVEKMLDLNYFVSNDSGVMNIANALGIPVMGLFGPTNPDTRGPLGARSSWIALDKDCAPCEVTKVGRETFMSGNCRCIANLSVDEVFGKVKAHMRAVGLTI